MVSKKYKRKANNILKSHMLHNLLLKEVEVDNIQFQKFMKREKNNIKVMETKVLEVQ